MSNMPYVAKKAFKEYNIPLNKYEFKNNVIRTAKYKNQDWILLPDICRCLNIKIPTTIARKYEQYNMDYIQKINYKGNAVMNLISKDGVRRLLLSTYKKHPEFKQWMLTEVIPKINPEENVIAKEKNITTDNKAFENQFNVINNKLDKVLELLTKEEVQEEKAEVVKEITSVKKENNILSELIEKKAASKNTMKFPWREWCNYTVEDLAIEYLNKSGRNTEKMSEKQIQREIVKPKQMIFQKAYSKLQQQNLIKSIKTEITILNKTLPKKKSKYGYCGLDVISKKNLQKEFTDVLMIEAIKAGIETYGLNLNKEK